METLQVKKATTYPLRLEPAVELWIREQARASDRSMNAEINRTLRQVKEAAEQKQTAA